MYPTWSTNAVLSWCKSFRLNNIFVTVFFLALMNESLYASCCSSQAAGGIGRLLAHERAIVEFANSTRFVVGTFDNHARFTGKTSPFSAWLIVEPELQIVTRLLDHLEPFIKLPMKVQKSEQRTSSSLADMTVGTRIPLWKEHAFTHHMPALSIVSMVRMPTGTSINDYLDISPTEITGTGKWLYTLSFLLEKEWRDVNFGLGYGFSFEKDYFAKSDLRPGAIHSPLLMLGISPHDQGQLSLSIAAVIHSQPSLQSQPLRDADRRKISLGFVYSFGLHSHIKINAQLGSDLPFDHLGKNFTNEVFFRLGMRFGVF